MGIRSMNYIILATGVKLTDEVSRYLKESLVVSDDRGGAMDLAGKETPLCNAGSSFPFRVRTAAIVARPSEAGACLPSCSPASAWPNPAVWASFESSLVSATEREAPQPRKLCPNQGMGLPTHPVLLESPPGVWEKCRRGSASDDRDDSSQFHLLRSYCGRAVINGDPLTSTTSRS